MTSQAFTMQKQSFMQFIRMQTRPWAIGLVAIALAGCENQLPTLTGENSFPEGRVPVTIETSVPAEQFVRRDTVLEGFGGAEGFLLVANSFDGALSAHTLARFRGFPDSVTYTAAGVTRREANFTYGAGRVVVRVDSTATSPRSEIALQLLPITQAWDSSAVSWENAVDRPGAVVPWRMPGGTVGGVAATASWVPGDTTRKDSVVWQIDSLTVARLARGEIEGLLVRSAVPGSRLEISRLSMSFAVRPAGRPDTAIAFTVVQGPQTFIVTPDPPTSPGSLRVGGVTAARTILQLDLTQTVSSCPAGQTGPGCSLVSLRDVTLNNVSLVLDPIMVPSGYRPLSAVTVATRRILEPELGRRSPLGEVFSSRSVPAASFAPGTLAPVIVDLTPTVIEALRTGQTTLDLAVVADVGQSHFGSVWFGPAPKLRVLYTIVTRPELP